MEIELDDVTTQAHFKVWCLYPEEEYANCLAVFRDDNDAHILQRQLERMSTESGDLHRYLITRSAVTEIKLTFVEAGESAS